MRHGSSADLHLPSLLPHIFLQRDESSLPSAPHNAVNNFALMMQSAEQSCTALVIFLQYNLHPFILKNNSVDFTGKREKKRIFPGITENFPSHMYGSKRRKACVLIDSCGKMLWNYSHRLLAGAQSFVGYPPRQR